MGKNIKDYVKNKYADHNSAGKPAKYMDNYLKKNCFNYTVDNIPFVVKDIDGYTEAVLSGDVERLSEFMNKEKGETNGKEDMSKG